MRGTYFYSSIRLHGVVRALLMKHKDYLIRVVWSISQKSGENYKTGSIVTCIVDVVLLLLLLWLYSHPLGLGRFFSILILYTVGRTPWTGDQPVARPLPTYRTTQTQNKRTDIHAFSGENPGSQCSSERLRRRGHSDRLWYCYGI
jgi:hypothetical protein